MYLDRKHKLSIERKQKSLQNKNAKSIRAHGQGKKNKMVNNKMWKWKTYIYGKQIAFVER